MIFVGIMAGLGAGNMAARAAGINPLRVYVATLLLLVPALIGAKALYVITHWELYKRTPRLVFKRNQGGAALYGALALSIPASLPVLAFLRISFGAFWDVTVFSMLTAMIFGRVGCLLNGCCAGRLTHSWIGMHLPDEEGEWAQRIPTQCLEAGWGVLLLITAILLRSSVLFSGGLFLLIAAGYALGRLGFESTRAETERAGGFTIHHALSVVIIVVSLATFTARWPITQEVLRWLTVLPATLM